MRVCRPDGWETVTFDDVAKITVADAPAESGIQFTLIGHRDGERNQIETDVVDVAERHEPLLDSEVPRTAEGESIALAADLGEHGTQS